MLAKVEAFKNDSISEDSNTDIPDFWKYCRDKGIFDVLKQHTKNHDIYGLCAPIKKKNTHFDYGIGMAFDGGKIPNGFSVCSVKPTLWAVFKCFVEIVDCIGETWDRIFKEFLPCSEYNMLDDVDFELYSESKDFDCFCEIWIPVEKTFEVKFCMYRSLFSIILD